jgi:tRNA pseudouridine38-40 synthase
MNDDPTTSEAAPAAAAAAGAATEEITDEGGPTSRKNKSTAFDYFKRKRKQQRTEGGKGEKKKNIRKKFKGDSEGANTIPNKGSYADPDMKNLFGVSIVRNADKIGAETAEKIPKKKVAMLVAFVGEQYSGFQINPGIKSIQAEMELALYRAGYLSERNFGFPHKYSWSNSARTDKGVHACAQVVSCWLQMPTTNVDEIRENINNFLPDDITVLDICRTTRNFCARTQRDRVRYMYMLPSFLLQDTDEFRKLCLVKGCHDNGRGAKDPISEEEIQALLPDMVKFRASAKQLGRLKQALSTYNGTHRFHNFTQGMKWSDSNSMRYIESFDALEPVVGGDGLEWIPTLVFGQSFLLNQIRKMVSLAIDAARGAAPMSAMEDSMEKRIMRTGICPAEGLFLDMSFFGSYNEKKKPDQPLDWTSDESPAVKRWRRFKEDRIMTHIMAEETKQHNFLRYIYCQEYHFERERYLPLPLEEEGKKPEGNPDPSELS